MTRTAFAIPVPTIEELRRSSGQRRRVLLVDDDPLLLRSLKRLLSMHVVTVAESVAEAKRVLASTAGAFDIVIADLAMPEGGGRALHRWMTATFAGGGPRLVFATGGAEEEDAIFLEDSGCLWMHKPVAVSVLRAAIEIA